MSWGRCWPEGCRRVTNSAWYKRMGTKLTEEEGLELIGDPEQLARELEAFSRAEQFFWGNYDRFLREHADKWVAIHDDDVLVADTLDALLAELDRNGIQRGQAFVEFVTTSDQVLVL